MDSSWEAIEKEIEGHYANLKDQPPHTPEQVAKVKALIRLYVLCWIHCKYDEVRKMVHPDYKQHNYTVISGGESIIIYSERFREYIKAQSGKDEINIDMRLKRIFVDGDYIIVHSHVIRWEGDKGQNVMDIFRYQDGQFTEHWDVITDVPDHCENTNGVF
ncbi:uncharacterized protein A1O9_09386 [Exophiala aquamarina CBS 119918]|uniref:SnoaL-like domain-containing protein n=1 Tax=Exophiala aquamarina CBS 119918 TaxID=1182545 RepID=A0A072P6N1_9EURO|nr:uncharacterized protein A1O9_09386 [Exophiala aquamarina CBS 119918]KEF54943.1 hypothetical protein A1O9_09386 [Exophiala aquamarina CBS 119918]